MSCCRRSGGRRADSRSCSTRREHHRPFISDDRSRRKASAASARTRSGCCANCPTGLGPRCTRSSDEGTRTHGAIHRRDRSRGRQLGAEVKAYRIDGASDLPQAFAAIEQARSQALIVKNNSLTYDLRQAILEASKRLRIPDMYEVRELVMAGGLVSDGPNVPELYRQSAGYVDSILKGPSHRTFRSSSPPSSNWCSISRPPRRSA